MNDICEQLYTIIVEAITGAINRDGYILDHDLAGILSDTIYFLVEQGILIGCDKIESTKNFMNSSYYFTWADNRFNLYIHTENNLSWISRKIS